MSVDERSGVDVSSAEGPAGEQPGSGPGREATVRAPTEEAMRQLGQRLAAALRPGDLIVLSGKLGAGKTTLVQGIGAGLGVQHRVTSPTFVLARVHDVPSGELPPLVHADAYRLGSMAELDDLDLDTPAEEAVTVVEWGEGLVEDLKDDRLEVVIDHVEGQERIVHFTGVGERWNTIFRRRSSGS